ncbi:hypothetical protein GCM10023169_29690 [Georgenia halophila]|uniref:Uncharacterized protein n=1 Tax=Georgenia halophila TaxID=620889 RepID=A0ABP8LF67_9MICO
MTITVPELAFPADTKGKSDGSNLAPTDKRAGCAKHAIRGQNRSTRCAVHATMARRADRSGPDYWPAALSGLCVMHADKRLAHR